MVSLVKELGLERGFPAGIIDLIQQLEGQGVISSAIGWDPITTPFLFAVQRQDTACLSGSRSVLRAYLATTSVSRATKNERLAKALPIATGDSQERSKLQFSDRYSLFQSL